MKSFHFVIAIVYLSGLAGFAAPPSCDQLLEEAKAKAAAEHKAIFVHFGASWCGWCKRLEAFLERPDIKPVFEKYFIPVKLVVLEEGRNKGLDNLGAEALFQKLGGSDELPYFAFLDAHEVLIVNSKYHGQNIAYPGEPYRIDWFVQMMRKAAPAISKDDLKTIETALRTSKKA